MNLQEAEDLLWKAHMDLDNPREKLKRAAIRIHDSVQEEFVVAGQILNMDKEGTKTTLYKRVLY